MCAGVREQLVVVADAELANRVLGNQEALSKGLEPDLSDKLLSHDGHRTMFSSDTNSPYWRLVRKGTAPAFIHKNIRFPTPLPACPLHHTTSRGPAQSALLHLRPLLVCWQPCSGIARMHCTGDWCLQPVPRAECVPLRVHFPLGPFGTAVEEA
jgi:hypothetical protein